MILLYAILFILTEAITEGLLKRFNKASWLFDDYVQWMTAIILFVLWMIVFALPFDGYYVETWKLIVGFVFVRFGIFDVAINLAWGKHWSYYGKKKWYDRQMTKLGSWGWFMKAICFIVGGSFLVGWN